MSSSGWRVHAVAPASAIDAPINFRNPRRPTGSSHSDAWAGNSRCNSSRNSTVSANSSRLRQYRFPVEPASFARMTVRSIVCSRLITLPDLVLSAWCGLATQHSAHTQYSALSVARRTRRQRLNLILADETSPQLDLIRRCPVVHLHDGFARPDVLFGMAVTVEAPFHLQRRLLIDQRHPIDTAVTGGAADALLHVHAVVEVDKVWQVVDAHPLQRFVVAKAGADNLEIGAREPNLRVAVH